MSKVQRFMFVSKTIYNKPCTTNQKPKRLKQKKQRNKRHEIKKKKNGNKEREKYLVKKLLVFIFNSQPLPILARKNGRG